MSNRMSPRVLGVALGVLLATAVAGNCAAQQVAAAAAPAQITIDNFAFEPDALTVAAGTKVTWVNHDDEPHTVVSADKAVRFKSQALDTNDSFSFVFDKPGTYKYFCSMHAHMVGTIVVQ